MKLKITGLVFVGFAAAVFAQSASAVDPDDKTVTSKTYVDNYAQAQAKRVTSTNMETIVPQNDPVQDVWQHDDMYPSMKVVNDKVGEVSAALSNLQADDVYIDIQNVGSGANAHQEITVNSNARATTAGSITDTTAAVAPSGGTPGAPAAQDKLVTASAVNAYAEAKDNKLATNSGAETITAAATAQNNNTSDTTYPTTKNVYQFVRGGDGTGFQPKLASGGKPSLGVYNSDGTSLWKAAASGTYVAVGEPANGTTITFDVSSDKIASNAAGIAGTLGTGPNTGDGDDLTTAQAVYDFVTNTVTAASGDYQPKVANTDAGNIMIGYKTTTGGENPTYGNSTWYSMKEGQQHGVNEVPFVRLNKDETNGEVWVDLYHNKIIGSDTINQGTGYETGGITSGSGNKLATGIAVYDYSVPMNWTERGTAGNFTVANKKLVTDASGIVVLADDTGDVIPAENEMPSVCKTANGGKVCALVAYYDADVGTSGGVKYEWTVMAPTN